MTERVQIGDATLYLSDAREVLPSLVLIDCVVKSAPANDNQRRKAA